MSFDVYPIVPYASAFCTVPGDCEIRTPVARLRNIGIMPTRDDTASGTIRLREVGTLLDRGGVNPD